MPTTKPKKPLKNKPKKQLFHKEKRLWFNNPQFFAVIGSIAFLIFLFSTSYIIYQKWKYSFTAVPSYPVSKQYSHPTILALPSLNRFIPIENGTIENGIWSVSHKAISHLQQSASPGEAGNIVLYGHNTENMLGNLDTIAIGDSIHITTHDGQLHRYIVERVFTVFPTDIEVVMPTNSEEVTLYTCTGIFDSKRLIVKAVPVTSTIDL